MTRSPAARLFVVAVIAVGAVTIGAVSAPTVKFSDSRLKNGLRVIIAEDHAAPVFSVAVAYNVGSRDERIGRTGFAHLFEHMMFKGSENVGAGEHLFTVISNGGTINGTTDKERTLYFETMPANQLDAALFLEADRMRSLTIVKDNLDNQRHAVQEERRLRVDNQPYGRADEAIEEIAFDNFAYRHSVIGSLDDLNAASIEDVASFFKTYYAPNNAVIAIVGDVNTASTLERARKYLRIDSVPAAAAAGRRQPAAAGPGTAAGYRGPAGAPASPRHRLSRPVEPVARRRRDRRPRTDPGERPQLSPLRARGAGKAARRVGAGVRPDEPGSAVVRSGSHARSRSVARPARAGDSTRRLTASRPVRSPIRRWRRPGTQRSASSSEASTRRWRWRGTWRSTRCCSTTPAGSISDGIGWQSSAPPMCSASRSSFSRQRIGPSS